MARKYGVEKMTMKSLWADYKLRIGFSESPDMEKWMEFFNKNVTYGDPNLDSSDAFSYGRKMGLAIKNLPSKDSPHYHFESLLHGMDNLIASETMPTLSQTRSWWNGLSSSAKREYLNAMSSTVSKETDCFNGTPKQFDSYCSEQKQDILYYMDALADTDRNYHTPYELPDGRRVGSW